ncbi:MAG: nucleotidyltransferase family protein [Candidatus Omnitrophica bacterium]|nr:nucleotidyltransferase family protein [Candidatus Omnitrophota bacterium]MBU1869911.1 nucleotidyltransferase family protein [Candidatus Omnitrophota bacterium]
MELSKEIFEQGDTLRFKAQGVSMLPFIRGGDILTIKKAGSGGLHYADILFFYSVPGSALVHRLIKKSRYQGKETFSTRGDALVCDDGYISEGNVLGKVIAIERNGRVIRIDRGALRILNIVYARFLPLSRWAFTACIRIFTRTVSPEEELITLVSRINLSEEQTKRLEELLFYKLNWDRIVTNCRNERTACFVCQNLRKFTDCIPIDALNRFEQMYYSTSSKNILIYEELKKIISVFQKSDIKVILLKGAFLAREIYRNIGLRSMTDIDILIKKEDLRLAHEVLISMGYIEPGAYKDFLQSDSLTPLNSLMYTKSGQRGLMVHLHWHLINSTWPLDHWVKKMDMRRIWELARPMTIDGTQVFMLSPEHLLIHLSEHALNHSFEKLIILSDIAAALEYYGNDFDWKLFREEAERFDLLFIVYQALAFVSRSLGQQIPQFEEIKPARRSVLEKMSFLLMRRNARSYAIAYFTFFSCCGGVLQKMLFIYKTIFPSRLVLAQNLGIPVSKVGLFQYFQRLVSGF